ncbi:MAG: pyridoxamine 5'-phosphate oxidase family protein [Thalassovita sp.]
MSQNTQDPIRPTDDEARALARHLLQQARFAALAVTDPDTGMPYVSRVALGTSPAGQPLTLISGLALHTRALRANPACALLVGEPGDKGDALAHPRLTVQASATALPRNSPEHVEMAAHYLRDHPKSKLYLSLGDFGFTLFTPTRAYLNGGFGRAFILSPADLGL